MRLNLITHIQQEQCTVTWGAEHGRLPWRIQAHPVRAGQPQSASVQQLSSLVSVVLFTLER